MPVGLPGYRVPGTRRKNKMKAMQYRQSEAGRLARKFYLMNPEVKARMALRRKAHAHLHGR